MAVDAWLFAEHPFKKGLARRTGFAIACFAAPMLIYYFWNIRYVGILVAKSASEGGTGETSAPLSAVVINGIKILLGQPVEGFYAERQSQFTQAMADMGHQFWTSDGRLSMIGQGRNVVVLILLVFLVAAICARGRQLKLRIGCIGVLSLVCFVGYNLMLALSYGFIFKPDQAVGLVDYNRYIYTYYIGWFFMALAHRPANRGWRTESPGPPLDCPGWPGRCSADGRRHAGAGERHDPAAAFGAGLLGWRIRRPQDRPRRS